MSAVNPIIPGFAPDPSLVKVGEWYYLVNSTFHMFPGLPIYASQDLISWKHICMNPSRHKPFNTPNHDKQATRSTAKAN